MKRLILIFAMLMPLFAVAQNQADFRDLRLRRYFIYNDDSTRTDTSADYVLGFLTGSDTASMSGSVFSVTYLRPDSDSSIGGWTDAGDGTTTLYASIDETSASDADYVKSGASPSSDTLKVGLSNPSGGTPGSGLHLVRVRYSDNDGSSTINLTVRLVQGTTVIASWVYSGISSTLFTAEEELNGTQIGNITDYTNLFFEFVATEV